MYTRQQTHRELGTHLYIVRGVFTMYADEFNDHSPCRFWLDYELNVFKDEIDGARLVSVLVFAYNYGLNYDNEPVENRGA